MERAKLSGGGKYEAKAINQRKLIIKVLVRVNNEFNSDCTMMVMLVK